MKLGPGDTTVQSQIQAQLQAGNRPAARTDLAASDPSFAATAAPRVQADDARQAPVQGRSRDNDPRGGEAAAGRSAGRNALTVVDPLSDLSSADEVEAAAARVDQLFNREAPAGRSSSRAEAPARLGQIIDIRV